MFNPRRPKNDVLKQIKTLEERKKQLRKLEQQWLVWDERQLTQISRLRSAFELICDSQHGENHKNEKAKLPHQRKPPTPLPAASHSLWNMEGWKHIMSSFNAMVRIRSLILEERYDAAQRIVEISKIESEIETLR